MADTPEVRLGADTSQVNAAFSDAESSVTASLNKIAKALEGFSASSKKTHDDVKKHTDGIAAMFAGLHENIRVRFGSINNVFEQFSSKLAVFGALFAGGALFKGAVEAMLHLEESVRGLAMVFGATTEKATQMAIALKLAGVSSEAYEGMAFRVGRVLKTQSEEFDRLKVVTRDSTGAFLPMDRILQNIYQRMLDFKAGTDQTEFALSTVGRNAKDFASDMERINSVTERAALLQKKYNIEMGPARIAEIEAYRVNLNETKIIFETIGERIGAAVLPNLERMAVWFIDVGPRAVEIIVGAVKVLITALPFFGSVAASSAIRATAAFEKFAIATKGISAVLNTDFSNAWSTVPKIVADANAKIEAINKATAESVEATWTDTVKRINALWAPFAHPEYWGGEAKRGMKAPAGKGTEDFPIKPKTGRDDTIAALDNELKAEQDAYNKRMLQQGSFETWSITQTRDYWEEVLSMSGLSAKDRREADNKYYDAERQVQQNAFAATIAGMEAEKAALGHNIEAKIAIAEKEAAMIAQRYGQESKEAEAAYKKIAELRQQLADQRMKIAEIETKIEEAHLTHQVEMAKLSADQQVALGQITNAKRIAMEADFENQMYAKKLAEYEKEKALAGDNIILAAQINEKILALQDAHEAAMTKLANQGVLDREKYALEANKQVESSLSTLLSDLAAHTKTVKQAFLDFFNSIEAGLAKIAANKLAEQWVGPGSQAGGFLGGIMSKIFGGGAGGATGAAALTTAGTTLTSAGTLLTTAAAALQSAAGTLAMSSGGGIFSGSSGGSALFSQFGGAVDSGFGAFETGTPYVPQDSLAMVHKGEAIIPASMNKPGVMGHTLTINQHFAISGAVDTRTQDQLAAVAATAAHRAISRIL